MRGEWEGQNVLGIRLNFANQHVALAPVSTLIGVAFDLRDPDGLVGQNPDLGLTFALVPSDLPGLELGAQQRLGDMPFMAGLIRGNDVFVPLDAIIGGSEMAGQGWRMLTETSAVGRSASVPALAVAGVQLATRVVSVCAEAERHLDTQFGRDEGIEAPLARIGGMTYLMSGTRTLTGGAVDAGEGSVVASEIANVYLTEGLRQVLDDALDIRAAATVCRGPTDILLRAHAAMLKDPTLGGSHVLTRSIGVFALGVLRCHPHVRDELEAVQENNLAKFDKAFFGHLGFAMSNAVRAHVLALSVGYLGRPDIEGPLSSYAAHLTRMSAATAILSDVAMVAQEVALQDRNKLSARLADALAWLYLTSAALKRFWDDGQPKPEVCFVQWSAAYGLHQIEQSLVGLLDNLPNRWVARALKVLVFPLGVTRKPPSDELEATVARRLREGHPARERLTKDIFVPDASIPGLGRFEAALDKCGEAQSVEAKIHDAVCAGEIDEAQGPAFAESACAAGVISQEERATLDAANAAKSMLVQGDDFASLMGEGVVSEGKDPKRAARADVVPRKSSGQTTSSSSPKRRNKRVNKRQRANADDGRNKVDSKPTAEVIRNSDATPRAPSAS